MTLFRLSEILCLMFCAASALAQGTDKDNLPTQNVQKAPLDAIVVFDTEGKRSIFLPEGWSLNVLDDFRNYLLKDKLPSAAPFVIQNVSANGTLNGNRIEATVKISLTLNGNAKDGGYSVRVPLALREAVIANGGTISVSDEHWQAFLAAQANDGGYAVILTTKGNSNTAVSLKLELPLWFAVRDNRFSVTYPLTVSSAFSLQIPDTSIAAEVTGDAIVHQDENAEKKTTEIKIAGLRNTTEIRWKKTEANVVNADTAVLSVEKAFYDYKLNASTTTCDAVIPVSISSGNIDTFKIRLPAGTKIDKSSTDKLSGSNYTIRDPDNESTITVQTNQKTLSQITVRFKTIQTFESKEAGFERTLTGFDVLGAERQSGFLSVAIPTGMKSNWQQTRGVRRTDNLSADSKDVGKSVKSDSGNTATYYEFITQPFALNVQAALAQTRTNVKPEYQFHVSKGLLQLTGRFAYTISGSKTDRLQIQMPDNGWNVEVGPQSVVDTVNVAQDANGLLTVPLRNPADGTVNLELRAYRLLTAASEPQRQNAEKLRLVLTLPKPLVTWSEPAPVVVAAANDAEIQPIDNVSGNEQQITGLTRQNRRSLVTRIDIPEGLQQEPLFYISEPAGGQFIADAIFHRQKVSATMQTEIRPSAEPAHVSQTISYDVSYSPIDKLFFLVPKSIEANGNIQIRCGNRILEFRDTVQDGSGGDVQDKTSERWSRKVLQLPEAMFKFQLTFQYPTPPLVISEGVTEVLTQQFIQPVDVPMLEHRIDVFVPPGCHAELPSDLKNDWTSVANRQLMVPNVSASFSSSKPADKIVFQISVTESESSSAVVADRAWIQTWLTGTIRQDRCTYLLTARRETIVIKLPLDTVKEQRVFVRIDNVPVNTDIDTAGMLSIPLTAEQRNRPIRLDVEYRFDAGTLGHIVALTPPVFEHDTLVRYAFWELILPRQKNIIGFPSGLIPEHRWIWRGLSFQQIAMIQKTDTGLDGDAPDVTAIIAQSNRYLFSSLQPLKRIKFYVADWSMLVFSASSVSLIAGLLLIYVPPLRYAGSLFGLGIALLTVLLYRPAPMLLLLQMSVFGVCLALLAGYIHRIISKTNVWDSNTAPLWSDTAEPMLTPIPMAKSDPTNGGNCDASVSVHNTEALLNTPAPHG
ncbi:hypothetical protein FACS1894170_00170 [Planctomycetales bacterium]|nr:hypothetical protein FACS1894170_00170 [Planctomycetales bacterium]